MDRKPVQHKKEIVNFEHEETIVKKRDRNKNRMIDHYHKKKKSQLISVLTSQLTNVPQFIEQLSKNRELILDVTKEIAEKIANGELEFIRKGATGEAVGILRDAKTKKVFQQLPIKEMPIELGSTIASAGLSMKLEEISGKLDELDSKINRVN